ncbi:MAG: hypothetical protein V4641_16230 [Pseudomonadota bacterium]
MNHLENLPSNIAHLLVFFVGMYFLYRVAVHRCESSPVLDDEPQPEPKAFEPDPAHIKAILADLRRPLPQFAKRDSGNVYDNQQDAADLARGTSDNVLVVAVEGK